MSKGQGKRYPTTDGRFLTNREAKVEGLKLVTLRLTDAEMDRVRGLADADGITPDEVFARAIRRALEVTA